MDDYKVGYGKPPKHSRFAIGNNANPKGRPKRKPLAAAETINNFLNGLAQYSERGRKKTATRLELEILKVVTQALKGDVKAAEMLLKLREHARKYGRSGVQSIRISDWLPDYPGQTAEQKTREFGINNEAVAPKWWDPVNNDPKDRDS